MLDMSIKKHLLFCDAAEVENLPDDPGIYAWFLPLAGDDSGNLKAMVNSLFTKTDTVRSVTEVEAGVGQFEIVMRRGSPGSLDEPLIQELNAQLTGTDLQVASKYLLLCSFLTAPIYVGMTVKMGLRERVKSHLQNPRELDDINWTGSFRSRVARSTENVNFLRRCLIACLPMPPDKFPPKMVRLFEHILLRVVRPAMSRRG